ncbi:MAG TPA: DsbA family protein [Meiothermus sp.]|nr:DsbA family protein [Meiothermus sp.]
MGGPRPRGGTDLFRERELQDRREQDQQLAARFGIQGVPLFVFDRKYGLSGAQPLEVFLQVIDELTPAAEV